jgi:hypothetical protein
MEGIISFMFLELPFTQKPNTLQPTSENNYTKIQNKEEETSHTHTQTHTHTPPMISTPTAYTPNSGHRLSGVRPQTTTEEGTRNTMTMESLLMSSADPHPLNILVVSSDLPSHLYATVKLAKVLGDAGHVVTLAAPEGPAFDCICVETQGINHVNPISAGTVVAKTHINVRPVIDPLSWKALFQALGHPLKVAGQANTLKEDQNRGTMYQTILDMILFPTTKQAGQTATAAIDVVIPIHSAAATVCDAVEVAEEQYGAHAPCIIFSSLPYDPCLMMSTSSKDMWHLPGSITALPHVNLYTSSSAMVIGEA